MRLFGRWCIQNPLILVRDRLSLPLSTTAITFCNDSSSLSHGTFHRQKSKHINANRSTVTQIETYWRRSKHIYANRSTLKQVEAYQCRVKHITPTFLFKREQRWQEDGMICRWGHLTATVDKQGTNRNIEISYALFQRGCWEIRIGGPLIWCIYYMNRRRQE